MNTLIGLLIIAIGSFGQSSSDFSCFSSDKAVRMFQSTK